MEAAKEEKCEFLPFLSPFKINTNGTRITSMEFHRNEETDDGEWVEDPEQLVKIKCDFIISAFGSGLTDQTIRNALEPIKFNKWNLPMVDPITMCSSEPWVFIGSYYCCFFFLID
jgi:dihydropyrimidine dehydrogenase (NADP+)